LRLFVFVQARTAESAGGTLIEVVEAGRQAHPQHAAPSDPAYVWAEFPELRPGRYTVRVRFPSGVIQVRQVDVRPGQDQVHFAEGGWD
jgi:hypothetical protein